MENIRTSPKESSRKDVNSKGIISPILLGEPLTTSDLPPIPIRYRMLLKNLVTCFKDSFLNQQSSVHQKIREHDLTFKWWSLKFWKKHGWIVFFFGAKSAEHSLSNFQSGLIPQVQSCAFLSNIYRSVSADKKGGPGFFRTWDWLKQQVRPWNQKNVLWLKKKHWIPSHHQCYWCL